MALTTVFSITPGVFIRTVTLCALFNVSFGNVSIPVLLHAHGDILPCLETG